jgi:hypothetical protein
VARSHIALADFSAPIGNGLVEQAETVAHAAICGTRKNPQPGAIGGDIFGSDDRAQPIFDQVQRQPLQIEFQTTRQNGDRQLLRIGGGEKEFDVRRWLL